MEELGGPVTDDDPSCTRPVWGDGRRGGWWPQERPSASASGRIRERPCRTLRRSWPTGRPTAAGRLASEEPNPVQQLAVGERAAGTDLHATRSALHEIVAGKTCCEFRDDVTLAQQEQLVFA